MRLQLLADDLVVALGIACGQINDVNEQPIPRHVSQERVAEAGAGARAFDEAGHICKRRATIVGWVEGRKVENAQIRLECRERICGHGRRCGR